MNFIPESLLEKTYICSNCSSVNKIDWLRDRGGPVGSFHHPNGKDILVRLSLGENCPKCDHINLIDLPCVEKRDDFYLFGDEAAREIDTNAHLYSYSLIGCSAVFLKEVEVRLNGIKGRFLPSVSPNDWRIHMKELWHGSSRIKNPLLKDIKLEQIMNLLGEIELLFNEFGPKIYKVNITLAAGLGDKVKKIKVLENHLKNEAYELLVLNTINIVTMHGAEPHFIFDAEKDLTDRHLNGDKVIQKWASDAFSKGTRNMLYCFMSHGIPVKEPIFVKPGSRPLLELADIISFVVARHNAKALKNEKTEIDCSMFGEVEYYTFVEKGEYLESKVSTKYPWVLFR